MKRNIYNILLGIFTIMTAWTVSSCSDESFGENSNGYAKLKFEAILPSANDMPTRVSYYEDADHNGRLMTAWNSGDQINIYGISSNNSYNFNYKSYIESQKPQSVVASWENNQAGYQSYEELVAVYPASNVKGNTVSIDFSNQDGTLEGLKKLDLMVSEKVPFDHTNLKFYMERKNVFLRIEVAKSFADSPNGITISIEGKGISDATYNLNDNSYTIDDEKEDKIEFTYKHNTCSEYGDFYLFYVVVPCINSTVPVNKITVSNPYSGETKTANFDINKKRASGHIYSTQLKSDKDIKEALIEYGWSVNNKIKNNFPDYEKKLTKITFKDNSNETSDISITSLYSDYEIYIISKNDGQELVISTPADKILTNNDPSRMFSGLKAVEEIENLGMLDTKGGVGLNIGGIITIENTRDLHDMFKGCESLKKLDLSSFTTSTITDFHSMFEGCTSLTRLDLSAFDTGNATDMSSMFSGCSNLSSLNVTTFNTANVTNMSSMFSGCSSLPSLNVTTFNTANVTNMSSMFSGCSSLPSLNVTSFNTAKVTNMSSMFSGCSNLPSLNVTSFNTGNVTNFSSMFEECEKLGSINCSSFNTGKATNMSSMFKGCTSLNMIDIHTFNTSSVTDFESMFEYCTTLKSINISSFNTPETPLRKHMQKMFSNCHNLAEYNFGINFYLYSFCYENQNLALLNPYIQDVFANTPNAIKIITSSDTQKQMINKQNHLKLNGKKITWSIIQ